jgi:hypothetical protein
VSVIGAAASDRLGALVSREGGAGAGWIRTNPDCLLGQRDSRPSGPVGNCQARIAKASAHFAAAESPNAVSCLRPMLPRPLAAASQVGRSGVPRRTHRDRRSPRWGHYVSMSALRRRRRLVAPAWSRLIWYPRVCGVARASHPVALTSASWSRVAAAQWSGSSSRRRGAGFVGLLILPRVDERIAQSASGRSSGAPTISRVGPRSALEMRRQRRWFSVHIPSTSFTSAGFRPPRPFTPTSGDLQAFRAR